VLGRTSAEPAIAAAAREQVVTELDRPGSIDPVLLDVLIPIAARGGDADLYGKLLARGREAKDPEVRDRFINALTAFTDPALVKRTLDYILGPEVRNQDAKLLIGGLLTNREAQAGVWSELQRRWAEVQQKTGAFVGNPYIVAALGSFCGAAPAAEIRRFFAAHPVPDAARTLQQSLERVEACGRIVEAQRPALDGYTF
jgi:aminopeptidase N